MTLEEAEKIVKDCDEWIGMITEDEAPMDGRFTQQQLEAVLTIMRAPERRSA